MPKKLLRRLLPSPHMPNSKRYLGYFHRYVDKAEIWSLTRYSVARGMAIGIFIGFLPIMPFQMLACGGLALLFRANMMVSLLAVWISNPITVPPLYYFCYKLGATLLGQKIRNHSFNWTAESIFSDLNMIWQPLFLGSIVAGVFFAALSYYLVLIAWRISVSRQWLHRKNTRKRIS